MNWMQILMTEFRVWQISHYTERLAAARTTEEKAFLRSELFHLKKSAL